MLELKNISVHFGGIKALNNISFKIEKESLFSIIGPNGMYAHYQQVSQEIERGEKNEGVWAKAFVESKGDLQQTKVKYIELMVERYILAEEAEKEALRLKEEEEIKS